MGVTHNVFTGACKWKEIGLKRGTGKVKMETRECGNNTPFGVVLKLWPAIGQPLR